MSEGAAECTEKLDPRVQIELERLNTATDEINRLEVELDEARLAFRRLLAEGHLRIQQLTKKLGTSVHKARPYYEARFRANITSQELHAANLAYDKANSAHAAAREMVYLAEQGLARLAEGSGGLTLDPAWQEMLNHATHRVNQAESERASATVTQRSKAAAHRAAAALVQQLQNGLKRHIAKSRPYFEEKARINSALEAQKARIQTLEEQVSDAKQKYSSALRNLERISDEIHRHRSRRQSTRNDVDRSTITDTASESNASETLEELCAHHNHENVREWLRRADRSDPDTWTEIDLDYSSPEEISFEKCSLRPRSTPEKSSPPSPMETKVSAASPRRIIRTGDRSAAIRAELERGRRQSLDALFHDTGEKVKEMFQGLSLFGERRGSGSAPRTPRRSSPRSRRSPAPDGASSTSDERYSDTDSLTSMEMLTDDQIASLMLDAQLEAVCERLAGVVRIPRSPHSPEARY
ncbi:guanine nucleotide exchange factor rei-2-like [Maniola jurtina]|uniref:guanine nucleotide exchange factor rei-2-like n=1 Tax=Maniola jurtina TaxID=191418 RepID=UPI001E6896D2|nr:guanine nucleotide exchange factor rei-2-like [Maniola jurtina]XP_045762675.1 guanine nucleotide exchange factor rei-2-like [Maniola jurtina]